jgi:hypothetical protein
VIIAAGPPCKNLPTQARLKIDILVPGGLSFQTMEGTQLLPDFFSCHYPTIVMADPKRCINDMFRVFAAIIYTVLINYHINLMLLRQPAPQRKAQDNRDKQVLPTMKTMIVMVNTPWRTLYILWSFGR